MVETYNITVGSAVGIFVALCLLVPVALIQWKRGYWQGREDARNETLAAWENVKANMRAARTAGDIVSEKSGAGSRDARDSSGLANRGRTRPT